MAYSKNHPFRFLVTSTATASNGSKTTATRTNPPNYDDFFIGEINPHWKNQVARRQNATTAYSAAKSSIAIKNPAYVRVRRISTGQNPHTMYEGFRFPFESNAHNMAPASTMSRINNSSLGAFINKCVSAQRYLQGGVVIGELRETIALLRNPARSLRRLIDKYHKDASNAAKRAARKRNLSLSDLIRKPRNAARKEVDKAIAGTYLEAVFGWRPLINDIKSAADALTSYDPNQTAQVQVTLLDRYAYNRGKHSFGSGGISEYSFYAWEVGEYSCRYKGAVWITSPYLKNMPNLSKFGFRPLRDFLPTLWELIPYSFLVDYFTNIGDIIQQASFIQSDLAWYCRTTRDWSEMTPRQFTAIPAAGGDFVMTASRGEAWAFARKEVARTKPALNSFQLQFSLPGSDSSAWANIAALTDLRRPKF
jgi:hypothetical protein